MNKVSLRLLGVGFVGAIFVCPFLVDFSDNTLFALLEIPFLLCMAIPLWEYVKGLLASHNHGREVQVDYKRMSLAFLKSYVILFALPFFKMEELIKDYKTWKLNRRPRTPKQHFKMMKPVVRDGEGNPVSMTGKGSIATLTIVSWLVFYFIFMWLKIGATDDFVLSSILATAVLGSLLGLYIRRRIKRQIVKPIRKAKFGRNYWITCSIIITLGLTASFNFGLHLWWLGTMLGLTLTSISYLKSVRGRGFTDGTWTGARFDVGRMNNRNFGNSIRGKNRFSFGGNSFKFGRSDTD